MARYNNHCDRHNLIPSFQLTYRPKHSCETLMVKLVNDLLWSMERREAIAVAVIDLSAAFDMVDHNILINLLHKTFEIGDKALRWFQSYLENRYCKVKIGKKLLRKEILELQCTSRKLCMSCSILIICCINLRCSFRGIQGRRP